MEDKHKKFSIKTYFTTLKKAGASFLDDRGLKMSAALAYYTIFSLAPLLIMLISSAGIIWGREAVQGKVFSELNKFLGADAALQIQQIIENVSKSGDSTIAIIIGFVTLFIGATGVFLEIQDTINLIWRVKAKPKRGWQKMLVNRFLSFSMIISLGFLLIVSLVISGLIQALSDKITRFFPDITVFFIMAINFALTFAIITVLFGIIFRFLPDVKIKWKTVRAGAIFTAILFMIGKYLINLYIQFADPGTAYGAAGSLIVVLVWVYYTAAILYFGAEFTQVYAEQRGVRIEPSEYAVHVVQTEEEKDVKVLPRQDSTQTKT